MRVFAFLLAVVLLFARFSAQADHSQASLARQIEREAETYIAFGDEQVGSLDLYLALSFRKYQRISGCDVTAEIEENSPKGKRVYGLTFDLSHTRLPDPADDNNQQWGSRDLGDHGRQGVIRFVFVAPYEPTPHGDLPENWSKAPVQYYDFVMEEMTDDQQPLRLLLLLNQYQDQYCVFSG